MLTRYTKKEVSNLIRVSESTKRKLLRLKGEFGVETYNEVVLHLINFYERTKEVEADA